YTNEENQTLFQNAVLSFRSNSCGHVVLVSGRCVGAPMEIMITEPTAHLLRGGVGASMRIQFVFAVNLMDGVAYFPIGDPQTLAVVGVYRTPDMARDPYWAGSAFALAGPEELTGLIGPDTLTATRPYTEEQTLLAYPMPGALNPDRLADVRTAAEKSASRILE